VHLAAPGRVGGATSGWCWFSWSHGAFYDAGPGVRARPGAWGTACRSRAVAARHGGGPRRLRPAEAASPPEPPACLYGDWNVHGMAATQPLGSSMIAEHARNPGARRRQADVTERWSRPGARRTVLVRDLPKRHSVPAGHEPLNGGSRAGGSMLARSPARDLSSAPVSRKIVAEMQSRGGRR
jgi:hypothetical protein